MKRICDPPIPYICRCRTIIETSKTFGTKGNHSDADSRFSHNSRKSKFDKKPNWKDLYCTSCKTSTKKGKEACKSILPPPRGPTQ